MYVMDSYFGGIYKVIGYDEESDLIVIERNNRYFFFRPNQEDLLGLYSLDCFLLKEEDAWEDEKEFDEIKHLLKRVRVKDYK